MMILIPAAEDIHLALVLCTSSAGQPGFIIRQRTYMYIYIYIYIYQGLM